MNSFALRSGFATLGWGVVIVLTSAAMATALLAGSMKGAVLAMLGAGFLATIFWFGAAQIKLWLGLTFLTAPFDISKAVFPPLERFYSPGLYVTIGNVAMLMLGVLWLFDRCLVKRLGAPFTKLDGLSFCFLGFVWLGALRSPAGGLAYASAIMYSFGVVGFYVVSHALRTKADVRLALTMIVAGFFLQAIYVGAQMGTHSFLTLPGAKVAPVGTQGLNFEAESISAFRPIGVFDHPNALADYLTLIVPPAVALVLMSRRRIPYRVWVTAGAVSVVGAGLLLLTLSRGGWAACLAGVVVVGVVFWGRRIIGPGHLLLFAGVTLAGLATAVAILPQIVLRLTESDSRSTESRIELIDQAFTIIKDHPLLGVGYGAYNRAAHEYLPPAFANISKAYQTQLLQLVVHNHYLLLASELGLPVMCFWIYLMLRFVRQPWPLSDWRDPGMFAIAVGLSGSLVSQMIYLTSDNYYADIRVFLLWMTAGLLQALTLQAKAATAIVPRAVAA